MLGRLRFILPLYILLCTIVFLPHAYADEKEYAASLACEIVQNLERQIKQDELLVSIDLFKTKENKIIPLTRFLNDALVNLLKNEGKKGVMLPYLGAKTGYSLTGFIRLKGEKAELYAKIIDTKTGGKLASYEIKSLETKWPSLYQEHFDDYLQKLVEDTHFSAIDQNFFMEEPVFQGKPEPGLGEYIRKTLGGIWTKSSPYPNVFDKKGASVHWTVKTEIGQAGNEYQVKMSLLTDAGSQNYSTVSVAIPARLAPFHLKGIAAKKFIIVSKTQPDKKYPQHQEALKTGVGNFLEGQNITWVNDASLNQAALRWFEDRSGKTLAEAANYVIDAQFLVEISERKGEEAAGGVKGTLQLNVYDTATGGLKTTANIEKGGTYMNENDIEKEVEKITKNIQGQLASVLKDKFGGL
ncbi:MAG: hypothetical protein HZA01_17185 [Nitrospinae bacterium]|nr:hypothetical protein [Nitrospinota bacterium]